jgi:hypothetical protein
MRMNGNGERMSKFIDQKQIDAKYKAAVSALLAVDDECLKVCTTLLSASDKFEMRERHGFAV